MLPLLLAQALGGDCDLSDGVYLLTMEPGDGVQTIFGHTAVLFYDSQQRGYSPVYDYGRFQVDPLPQMAWEVLTMTKPYYMGSRSLEDTIGHYDYLGRGVTAQRLALSGNESDALAKRLSDDLNADLHFDYNWFRPNCTTMVQDRLDEVLGGLLTKAGASQVGSSPADEVLRHSGPLFPLWLGLRWGSGRTAHTPVSAYETAFLPDGLRAYLDEVERAGQPLVSDTCVIGAVEPTPVPQHSQERRGLLALAGIAWGGSTVGAARARRAAGLAMVALTGLVMGLWGSAALLVGSLGTFAPFWGGHNLLLASPLTLSLVGAAIAAHRSPTSSAPQRLAIALLGIAVIGLVWSALATFADRNTALAVLTMVPLAGAVVALQPR